MSTVYTELLDRLASRRARVGVVGLGYVGLPLAVELARAGFQTVGVDVDAAKVAAINRGASYIPDVAGERLAELVRGRFDCDVIVTDHRTVNYDARADWADLVGDARDAVKRPAPHVLRLGAPAPVVAPDSPAEAAVAQAG